VAARRGNSMLEVAESTCEGPGEVKLRGTKPIVLGLVRYYVPGFKAGGPIRTLKAMVEHLSGAYQFKILALDRDLGETSPFLSIRKNEWNQVGLAQVRYFTPGLMLPFSLIKMLRQTEFDILYFNSFLDPVFTLALLAAQRLGLIPGKPVIVAPRGELSPGALAQKRLKKLAFLKVAACLGLYRNAILHASTDLEKSEIERTLGRHLGNSTAAANGRAGKYQIRVARDMASAAVPASNSKQSKLPGRLKAVFISRISPKKNLAVVIEMLSQVRGDVSLDIYGPIDDSSYWKTCQRVIAQRCGLLRVEYQGALGYEQVQNALAGCDAFVFPTLGENFGHVILESLLAGCPVVISDQTPWRELAAKKAGWDLPLREPGRFIEVLQALANMGEEAHRSWREGAKALGLATLKDDRVLGDNLKLFADLLGGSSRTPRNSVLATT